MVKVTRIGMYLGEYRHNLTEKNRVALPKRIRVEIDAEVILTKGFEACIAGFDKKRWQQITDQQLMTTQFSEDKGRILRRQLFSSAMVVEVDGQGRVVLPDVLLKWAGLIGKVGEELVIIGAGDHFEIWNNQNWQDYQKQKLIV